MKPDWRIDLSICTVGCTVERIGQNLQDESLYRRLMDGNVRWGSRHWRTKSFNRLGRSIAEAVLENVGGLNVLVNNAGFSHLAPFEQVSEEQFKAVIDTNFYVV